MKITNEEQLDEFLEAFDEIQRIACPIADALFKEKGYENIKCDSEDIHIENECIIARVSWRDRYQDWTEIETYINSAYLFDPDFATRIEEKHRLRKEEEKRLEKEKAAQEKERKRETAAKKEYEKYLELKSKYEGDYDDE